VIDQFGYQGRQSVIVTFCRATATLRPSTYPVSFKPSRKAGACRSMKLDERLVTTLAGCCARTTTGHATGGFRPRR
jgi:hypothetical protein